MKENNGNLVEMIMTTQIDQEYFDWLVAQIEIHDHNPNTYHELFERMHNTEFIWTVPNDDNRVQDGLDLRTQFLNWKKKKRLIVEEVFQRGATVLEVLIGLSRRVAFMADGEAPQWAWHLIENLELQDMSDPLNGKVEQVDEILEALIWRTYEPDGHGGFFPLRRPKGDQTEEEIWHQMNLYVGEIQGL